MGDKNYQETLNEWDGIRNIEMTGLTPLMIHFPHPVSVGGMKMKMTGVPCIIQSIFAFFCLIILLYIIYKTWSISRDIKGK